MWEESRFLVWMGDKETGFLLKLASLLYICEESRFLVWMGDKETGFLLKLASLSYIWEESRFLIWLLVFWGGDSGAEFFEAVGS